MKTENSEIIPFFEGKTIFLTGATGFVGKLLIDQLLRKCEPKKLYLLIRSKKGVEPKQRFEQLFQDDVYEILRKEKPNFTDKVELINGDLSEDFLGLNDDDRMRIVDNVNIVIHGGATVRFDEHIKKATDINVKGTLSIVKLCHQIKNLISFVYVSTAFSNCPLLEIKEEFYEAPISCDELIKITDNLKDKNLDMITPQLLGNWPNSYSFTKAVAEDAVKVNAQGLPVCVFRPAIIVGTVKEPLPGWIDNVYGPTGLLAGAAVGVLRVIRAEPDAIASIVPADMVAFSIIAATYKTSLMGPTNEIPIYNYVTSKENPFTWANYMDLCKEVGADMPLEKAVWNHSCRLEPNPYLFAIYSFFLHMIPAVLVDLVLLSLNKKRSALKMVEKVNKFMAVLSYFATKTWTFSNNNVEALWSGLCKEDKELFNFDMKSLDWKEYFKSAIPGVRLYIFKESLDTVPAALKKQKRRVMVESFITMLIYGFIAWIVWKFASTMYALKT